MPVIRAVLDATDPVPELQPFCPGNPVCLLPLLDRPFVQHVIEYLVRLGIKRVDVILGENPRPLEMLLGDGVRWGLELHYHLEPVTGKLREFQRELQLPEDEPLLFGSVLTLPAEELSPEGEALYWTTAEAEDTGWARMSAGEVHQHIHPESGWLSSLPSRALEGPCCRLNSAQELLSAQQLALTGQAGKLEHSGTTGQPGVWLGRNVVIHPTAVLTPPLFIGEDTRIGRGAVIGPSAVIGKHCRIEEKSTVSNSLVMDNSFVGEMLELEASLADRNRLLNTRLGQVVEVEDDFLLGSMRSANVHYPVADRLLQMGLTLLLLPCALLCRLFRLGRPLQSYEVVVPPLVRQPARWRCLELRTVADPGELIRPGAYFRGVVLPNLIPVLRGQIQLLGSPPHTREALMGMDSARRTLYSSSRPALIHESRLLYGARPDPDLVYATEAVYAVQAGSGFHFRLFWKFLASCIFTRN